MIYVILGMHKSGTTLTSQILHHSGINMVDEIKAQEASYDRGDYYELDSAKAINMEIMRANGYQESNWRKVLLGTLSRDNSFSDASLLTKDQRTRMREILSNRDAKYAHWGFKDPRTCLVYPLWALELPEHKIIAIFRSHNEQWQRHRPQSIWQQYREPYKIVKFIEKWCRYNANVLAHLQKTQMDFLVLDYQRLMTTQAEFDRLQEFVGLELEDRRKKDLYRNRPKDSVLVKIATRLVYKQTGHHPEKIMQQFEALR